ncbi:GNAT family N-acetyltransferase [Jeongeupia sp. USM3]|uniref:GNAT family N-acetyltransferase n=1 Tax=Jeongeupia sp. USM3 TaxID=1906741 RepID=UPI00196A5A63|nr:hypothetical protein [Jeongeupia sp. USM3]
MTDQTGFTVDGGSLAGRIVRLEPYIGALKHDVRIALDCDPDGWNLFAMSGQGIHFESWWTTIMAQVDAGRWIAYAVRECASGRIVGTSSFLNFKPAQRGVEIGGTFLHPSVRSTLVNAGSSC